MIFPEMVNYVDKAGMAVLLSAIKISLEIREDTKQLENIGNCAHF